jgi:hypothetical protein
MVAGFSVKNALKWKWMLVRTDPPTIGETIQGQFQAEDYTEEVSTVWASVPIPKRSAPHVQWVRGEEEISTFSATLWAETIGRDISGEIAALKAAIKRDDFLTRPPQFTFIWGSIRIPTVVVLSIGAVKYDDLWADGRVRGARFEITLQQLLDPLPLSATDPSAPSPSTRYRPALHGDTYESLALRQYNDALLGVFVRQDSLIAFPQPGDVVPMPSARTYLRRARLPQAYALANDDPAKAARQMLFDDYSAPVRVPFVTV